MRMIVQALALMAGTEATALRCTTPDPVREFRSLRAVPDVGYVTLYGTLAFDEGLMPRVRAGGAPEPDPGPVAARFEGMGLDLPGFIRPVRMTVMLQPVCAGPWCGAIGEGTWLLMARVTDAGYVVEIDPCGSGAYEDPTRRTLDAVAACLRGEPCEHTP